MHPVGHQSNSGCQDNLRDNNSPTSSALGRLFEIGSLATSIGLDLVGNKAGSILKNSLQREKRDLDTLIGSAVKMAGTLGNLKGAAMKVGQMLSLYDSFLPPEVIEILSTLQKQAPPVLLDELMIVLENDIPHYKKSIKNIERTAIASASIGQVHRARLYDGRHIVLKIQYPGMDKAVASDIKNLRILLRVISATLPFKADVNAMLEEVHEMIMAELDYLSEAKHQSRFNQYFKGQDQIVIPEIIEELSGKCVLASIYEPGYGIEEIMMQFPEQANQIGQRLFRFYLDQIFNMGILHSDPNAGNFAFRSDGTIVVYDFGSVKKIPDKLIQGYRKLFYAILEERSAHNIPAALQAMGIHKDNGNPIKINVVEDWFVIYEKLLYEKYCFGSIESTRLIEKIRQLGKRHFLESLDLVFPADVIFVDRAMAGMFGNLGKLGACGNWVELISNELGF